jgi:hypothetical protein
MGDDESAVGFDEDIKPLFREEDRQRMDWAFDLWDYEAVKDNSDTILERLEAGDMPCDGAWPDEDVAKFRAWIDAGMAP